MPYRTKDEEALLCGTHLLGAQLGYNLAHHSVLSDYFLRGPSPSFFTTVRWVFGLSLVPFLSLFVMIIMYDVNVFEKQQQKLVNVFRPKDIFFDFRTKYLFGPA